MKKKQKLRFICTQEIATKIVDRIYDDVERGPLYSSIISKKSPSSIEMEVTLSFTDTVVGAIVATVMTKFYDDIRKIVTNRLRRRKRERNLA